MKIHYLITSLESGGAEAAVPAIIDVMQKAGHEVELTACEPRDMVAARLLDEANIPYRLLFDRRHSKLATIRAFGRLIKQSRPDVIWTSLSAASLVGMVTGARYNIPVVSWKHSSSIRLHTRLTREMSKLWVADSPSVANFMTDKLKMSPNKVATWPIFEQLVVDRAPPIWTGDGVFQIGSIGRLHAVKNYDKLIEAVAQLLTDKPELLPKIKLTIVGDGPERGRLEKLIERYQLAEVVSLPGAVTDVRPWLLSWHLYMQPSRYEGMCLAAHEAMSAGLPVAVTPVGELKTSVTLSEGGVLLEGELVHAISNSIVHLMHMPAKLQSMGLAAKSYIENSYGKEAFQKAGFEIIRRVAAIVDSYK